MSLRCSLGDIIFLEPVLFAASALKFSVTNCHGGESTHAEADIEGTKSRVACEINHIVVLEFEKHEANQFFSNALMAIFFFDFKERDVGAKGLISKRGDETNDLVAIAGDDHF